ncbi:hypothetical protein [Dactylosporangium sp. NPDC005555]|uniref:hypothetical protein n=1 Tax=Dactylosporangium sp. NPDC005555 TaxID=3154889 RepID=UPI0033BCEE57
MTSGRFQIIGTVVALLATLAVTGCARAPGTAPAAVASDGSRAPDVDIYAQVLRRYLGNSSENSFPERTFTLVYVMDRTFANAGEPTGNRGAGVPIAEDTRQRIAAALAPETRIVFVAERSAAVETKDGCAQVKDGGILITLGPVEGGRKQVEVGIEGFVACLGATWLTYVVRYQSGDGWQVTGTTGPVAVS